jgi:hypothetical protein
MRAGAGIGAELGIMYKYMRGSYPFRRQADNPDPNRSLSLHLAIRGPRDRRLLPHDGAKRLTS